MYRLPALLGSPRSSANFTPFGRIGGASPHFTSEGVSNTIPESLAASFALSSERAVSENDVIAPVTNNMPRSLRIINP